jgi:hypothetical protein
MNRISTELLNVIRNIPARAIYCFARARGCTLLLFLLQNPIHDEVLLTAIKRE